MHNSPHRDLHQALQHCLQMGLVFVPEQATPQQMTVTVHNTYTSATTQFAVIYGNNYFYPTAGKPLTKQQIALITPVMQAISINYVSPQQLQYIATPAHLSRGAYVQEHTHTPQSNDVSGLVFKIIGLGLLAIFAFPVFIVVLALTTSKYYK